MVEFFKGSFAFAEMPESSIPFDNQRGRDRSRKPFIHQPDPGIRVGFIHKHHFGHYVFLFRERDQPAFNLFFKIAAYKDHF